MNIVVRMPAGSYSNAQHIYQIQELENRLLKIDGIQRVRSITDVLREVNSLLHRRSENFSGLPENPVSLEALLRLVDGLLPGERLNWLAEDYGDARIFIEISDFSSRKIEGIIHEIEALVPEIFPDGHSLMFSGSTYQVARMNQYITRGLVQSIAVALLTISLIMILVFRSFRWGLIAMIPNVFPVIIAGGILGFAGIPLEFVTMTVAPIILGLAVDDTIHFMSFLKEDMADTGIFEVSLVRAFNSVGTAITETTFILCVTFLVFLISRINSIMYMGIIAASGMVAAYLADILVTPILVRQLTEFKKKKRTATI
jgi:predicted RND superfamily exporter protein